MSSGKRWMIGGALVGTWKWRAADRGNPRMTWRARLDEDMKDIMGLRPGMATNQEKWRCGIMERTSDPHKRGNNGR